MMIDFNLAQQQKFATFAQKIMAEPLDYVDFYSVSDFYKVPWLNHLPYGTTLAVSGLDDGALSFYVALKFKQQFLNIDIQENQILLNFQDDQMRKYFKKVIR